MMDVEKIRKDFPFLKRGIIYFDNAASSQKPIQVIDAIKEFYENHYANIHRGIHTLSEEASEMYEESKKVVAKFINANSWREIVYTRNTTESLNIISQMVKLKKGDKVVTTIMEHHSNFLPWLRLKHQKGIKLEIVNLDENQELDMNDFEKKAKDAKVISVGHMSNVLGYISNIKEIRKIADENDSLLVVDGAQSVPHIPVDVKKLGIDFLAFSSHKMLGPSGIGVLYAKEEHLREAEPFLLGGGMISDVFIDSFEEAEIPWKFEAGTPFIEGAIGLRAAVEYLTSIGMDEVEKREKELIRIMIDGLEELGIEYYGPKDLKKRGGLVSFNIKDLNAHDVAEFLNEKKIAVRSGLHCAHPLHRALGINGSVRASLYIYNTKGEVQKFLEALKELIKLVG
ncbi:MAG: cysteine desulfurase [Candidatus Aenigmarchaeota archaeon]|nr:cysteine desulfurase [Candidatus Aenigmarchaeota archaeon]